MSTVDQNEFYERLDTIRDLLPKGKVNILLDFNTKIGKKSIFNPAIGCKSRAGAKVWRAGHPPPVTPRSKPTNSSPAGN